MRMKKASLFNLQEVTKKEMTRKNERRLILSDALLCAILKKEADNVGVTLEEFVDRFLVLFYKDPNKFRSILCSNP